MLKKYIIKYFFFIKHRINNKHLNPKIQTSMHAYHTKGTDYLSGIKPKTNLLLAKKELHDQRVIKIKLSV